MGTQQRVVSLSDAFERAQRGNLIYAEIVARHALGVAPAHFDALNLLAFAALRAGVVGPALDTFRLAHEARPQAGLGATISRIEEMLPAWLERHLAWRTEDRFLLIKAWGYGFGSDLTSLIGSLLLAEITNRTPVIHWGPNSLYSDGGPADSFHHFFAPINALRLEDLRQVAARGVFPAKWSGANLATEDLNKFQGQDARLGALYFLERDEPLAVFDFNCGIADVLPWIPKGHAYDGLSIPDIYRLFWRKYFRPSDRVTARIEQFVARHWPQGPVLAVHMRDGDHRYEQANLLDVNAQYFATIDRLLAEQPAALYLMTDSSAAVEAFRARYGDIVFTTDAQRTPDDTGIHYREGTDRVQLGVDILSDMLLATRADRFVGNGRSSPSATVWQLKKWPPGTAHMIVPNIYEERNIFLYDF